jgi:hypothetical protein
LPHSYCLFSNSARKKRAQIEADAAKEAAKQLTQMGQYKFNTILLLKLGLSRIVYQAKEVKVEIRMECV